MPGGSIRKARHIESRGKLTQAEKDRGVGHKLEEYVTGSNQLIPKSSSRRP